MGGVGIYVSDSSRGMILGGKIVGFDIGIYAVNTNELMIKKATIGNCRTGVSLENCWDSEITDISIINRHDRFKVTNLSMSIIRARNMT